MSNKTGKYRSNTSYAVATPIISAVRDDGSEEDILEEELYRYTRHRWVYNESHQLSKRYLKFDLQQLLKVAVAASEGAQYCTKVLKCKEGLNNKAYLFTMDNGSEIFAKLPNPCAGPSFYTTASEVATREFLRDALNIPTPRILAWSTDKHNLVGAEYILEEKAQGKLLGSLWKDFHEWPLDARFSIVAQIVEMERKLASTTFLKSGGIYFKEDFPDGDTLVTIPLLHSSILNRFTIGPVVANGLWYGERGGMDLNRGPYNTPHEFIEAMGKNEIEYIQAHACPRMNYARSISEPELPNEMLNLLDQYLQLVPAIMPPESANDTQLPTLWHPDLHLDNVFVDPKSKQITFVIDWQSASVLPFFCQCQVAPMFKHKGQISNDMTIWPKRPANYQSLEQYEKDNIDNLIRSECIHKYYLTITHNRNPRLWAALQLQDEVRMQPIRIVQNVWDDCDVFFLRRALMRIASRWEDLHPHSGLCPVVFEGGEMSLHAHEEENRGYVSEVLTLFKERWGLSTDGKIELARFEEVQTELTRMRDAFIGGDENDEDRVLAEKLWPYQDNIDK